MNPPSPRDRPADPPAATSQLARKHGAGRGRVIRWSVAILLVSLVGLVAILLWPHREPALTPPVTAMTAMSQAASTAVQAARVPTVRFTDVTTTAGIRFMHFTGAEGERLLPETMGGGAAFLDLDADGDQDILFVNGTPWPWARQPSQVLPTPALYENDGQGRFTETTAGSGLDISFYGMGVACGDIDNDGLPDLFLTAVGPNRLFKNLGKGRFTEITATAGVAGDPTEWSTSAAFIDIDRDGDLDLFVANYVRWSRDIDLQVGFTLDGRTRAYGPPMSFQGTFPYLYRNEGGGRFTDISASSGVQVRNPSTGMPMAKSLGVAPADLNADGWIDLVVANDTVQNFVFINRHDGTFAEAGAVLGIAFDAIGNVRGAMGINITRHRNDSALAIGIGNFANEMTALYVSQGITGAFVDEAIPAGVGPASRLLLKFGLLFLDYDLDGWPDLLTSNGHLEEGISQFQPSQQYRQPAQLFWNSGQSSDGFIEIKADRAGEDLFQPLIGRGSAYADIDNDGDVDLLLLQAGGPPLLLRNDQQLKHAWVRFHLTGTRSNRDGIGAWIQVTANGITQSRQVMPARSYLSQSELPITFGLGKAEHIDAVEILWPSGMTQKLSGLKVNKAYTIAEAAGATSSE